MTWNGYFSVSYDVLADDQDIDPETTLAVGPNATLVQNDLEGAIRKLKTERQPARIMAATTSR